VDTAEDFFLFFHAVPDDPASAMRAARRKRLYRAFEAIKDMTLPGHNHLERLVIVVSASLTISHIWFL